MATEDLRAVFNAVETISETLQSVEQSISSLQTEFSGLDASMAGNAATSQVHEQAMERLEGKFNKVENEISSATRSLELFTGVQNINIATAATHAGAMELAEKKLDEMGDEALTTAGQMGVLDTVMKELSLSGSALSVNIGAFNVSLRNLAPLVPIAASMGTVVSVAGAFAVAIGNAAVAMAAFTGAGMVSFLGDIEEEFEGVTNKAEALEALMGGLRDLFVDAFQPLIEMEGSSQFFINVVEGLADLANRFAQAVSQMRDIFMPFFGEVASIVNREFDAINTAFANTFDDMAPIILDFLDWFLRELPDAIRFMTGLTEDLAGPIGNLGNSILDVLTAIIEVTVNVIQGLAPAFAVAADLASQLIDLFEVLGNGFLQAILFLGGLTLAATKFVGIANTMANISITAANSMVQFAKAARMNGGIIAQLNSTFSNSFKHLQAFGKLLAGQITLAQASGQKHKNLTEKIQDQAGVIEEAEDKLTALRNAWLELNTAVEGTNVAGDATEQIEQIEDSAGRAANNLSGSAEFMGETMEGVAETTSGGFADIESGEFIDKDELAKTAQLKNVNRELGTSFDDIAESMDESGNIVSKVGRKFAIFSDKLGNRVKSSVLGASESVVKAASSMGTALTETFLRTASTSETGLSALTTNIKSAASSMRKLGKSALFTAGAFVRNAAMSIVSAISNFVNTAATQGLTVAMVGLASSLWGAVTGFAATAAGALTTAATFLSGLIPAAISAGIALNSALLGIPALLAAIVALAGLVAGVLLNMESVTSGAKSAFEGLKSAIVSIGDSLLKVGVPAWNLYMDILEIALAPALALFNGLKMIASSLGLVSDEGEGTGSIIGMLLDGFDALMSGIGALIDFVAPAFSFIGDILFAFLITPFKIIAGWIDLVTSLIETLFNIARNNIPLLDGIVKGFNNIVDTIASIPSNLSNAFDDVSQFVDSVMSDIMSEIQPVIDAINDIIEGSNKLIGTDFEKIDFGGPGGASESLAGLQGTTGEARQAIQGDTEEEDEQAGTQPQVDLSLEDSVENNVDVQADPEDKAQLSRVTKDALEEANSFARRQQGG